MKFKKLAVCLLSILVLIISGSAHVLAQEADVGPASPDLRGTWNTVHEDYCSLLGYFTGSLPMVITDQTGGVFVGYFQEGPTDRIYFNGAVLYNQIRITDEGNAIMTGTLVNLNTIMGTRSEPYEPEDGYCTSRFKANRID